MKKVQTVLGPISPEDLGVTYPHIHIYIKEDTDGKGNVLPDIEKNVEEMVNFRKAGGNSVVDGGFWGGRAKPLAEISKKAKINIIITEALMWQPSFEREIGYWEKKHPPPPILDMPIGEVVDEMVKTVKVGVEGTNIKAGVIKTGAPYNYINPYTERALKVIARAQIETSVPIFLHTSSGSMGIEQLEVLKKEGADLSKVGVGHIDRNPDPWYYKQMVKMGANLIFDHISKVKYWPDSMHVENIRKLVKAGYEDRITLSLDYGHYRDLKAYGGGVGYAWVLERFVPRLRDEGFKEETINNFLVENPKNYLAF